jgi:sulfonate transport system ATP-binding protein
MVTHDVEEAVTLADRIIVMQPNPGRIFDEFDNPLARPRDRLSPAFEASKREVLRTLDRSLANGEPHQHKAAETAGMWW